MKSYKKRLQLPIGILITTLTLTSCNKEGEFKKIIKNESSYDIELIVTNKSDISTADTVLILKNNFHILVDEGGENYASFTCDLPTSDSLSPIVKDHPSMKVNLNLNSDAAWEVKSSDNYQECLAVISDDKIILK